MGWTLLLVAIAACAEPPAAEAPADAIAASVAPPPSGPPAIAFVDVTVIGMETPEALQHQTVIVEGGAISALGPVALIAVPARAERIDGHGKFLIPGLHDMHVHLDGTRGMLALFVGSGVTTVRNMAGSPRILALRDRVAKGELLAPRIYTAGPFVDGERPRWEASDVVATPADAERVVAAEVAAGYDFIKIYNGLSLEAYDAVAAAAKAHGVRIVGHVPFAVPLEHVFETGQASVEHLAGYAEAIERADSPVRHRRGSANIIKRWLYADPARIPEIAAAAARHGVWNCPTLVTAVVYGDLYRGRTPVAGDLDSVSPDWRARWDPAHSPHHVQGSVRAAMEQAHTKTLEVEMALVRELTIAGAPLLAGTDTPNPYVVPGASLHQELALFVEAGLSPYVALRAATIDAADFLGDPHDGRIAVAARADLVMLDADPLDDIRAIDRISGVMVRGTWLPADKLHALHDDLIAEYKTPAWDATVDLGDAPGRAIQYLIADNGAPVGAYAMARHGGAVVERQTLEDETTTAHETFGSGGRLRSLALDIERPEGAAHVDHSSSEGTLVSWLTPATAFALVESLVLDIDQRVSFSISQPDIDAPTVLRRGQLTISRLEGANETQRVFRLRLTIDRVAWVGRIILDGDGAPRMFRLSWTSRPITRTWTRRESIEVGPPRSKERPAL